MGRPVVSSFCVVGLSLITSYILYRWYTKRKHERLGRPSGDDRLYDDIGEEETQYEALSVGEQDRQILAGLSENDHNKLTGPQTHVMVSLIDMSTDHTVLLKVLTTIQNSAAFTTNQDGLREAGALPKLSSLLSAHRMALRVGQSISYPAIINGVISSINNMAMNQRNQKHLKECIPALIDFASTEKADESIHLASLQALTNLSVDSDYHTPYTKLIQQLYEYLDGGSHNIQIQALRVLANLSTNQQMVPHLLAAKAPSCLLSLLAPDTQLDVLIRWTTVLANIIHTVRDNGMTATSLPLEYKAPSPETTYTALYGHVTLQKLKSKVFVLCRHSNADVRHHASRIHNCLT